MNQFYSKHISDDAQGKVNVVDHIGLAFRVFVVPPFNFLSVENLQKADKSNTIAKVLLQVIHAHVFLGKMHVDPTTERLVAKG